MKAPFLVALCFFAGVVGNHTSSVVHADKPTILDVSSVDSNGDILIGYEGSRIKIATDGIIEVQGSNMIRIGDAASQPRTILIDAYRVGVGDISDAGLGQKIITDGLTGRVDIYSPGGGTK